MSNYPDLVDQLKRGDKLAFVELIDQYQRLVFNTILSIVQQHHDAEDLTQEVFIKVYTHIHDFRGEAKLSTWIYKIAVSKALEWERKKKTRKAMSYFKNLVGISDKENEVIEFNHPGIQLQKKEQAALLFKAIRELPEHQKIAFILIKVEGLNYQQVSEIMNKNIKSIEGLMHRAKENLRKTLKELDQS